MKTLSADRSSGRMPRGKGDNSMKKIINNPNDVVSEMLKGLAKANTNVE